MVQLINKKIVFHIHTKYSYDSNLEPKSIVDNFKKNNIDTIIITDHNSIKGALEAQKHSIKKYNREIEVIVGEEIKTDIGDIIGFPLTKKIHFLKYEKVIEEIKKQGGFVCLPHPYKQHNLFKIHYKKLLETLDFIEIFNSRCRRKLNKFAKELQETNKIKPIIATDAHTKKELLNTEFVYNSNYEIIISKKNYSKIRDIRLSQLIKYYRAKKIGKFLKYFLLYILGK